MKDAFAAIETLEVELPAGVAPGRGFAFPAKAMPGVSVGRAAIFTLWSNVTPHPFFTRIGDNIHCSIPMTVTEAALGTKIEVPTIDGRAMVRIPPGTQTGQTFRLRGKGAPSLLDPGMRGDQYVEVRVVVPQSRRRKIERDSEGTCEVESGGSTSKDSGDDYGT